MAQFSNNSQSHDHSLEVLNLLREHDTFMESISSMADMGAGSCLDTRWWASLSTRDDSPEPLNLRCYAVDRAPMRIDFDQPENMTYIQKDFEKRLLPVDVDVIWCHDAFQYAINPLNTLKLFSQQMNVNGLLYIGMPLPHWSLNRQQVTTIKNYEYYNHSFLSLVYMLAVNGFDCKDAYFRKQANDPWLHAAVFKTDNEPMDPAVTTWYDLMEKGLIHDSIMLSLRQFGMIRQQDVVFTWLDKNIYHIED